MDELEVLFRTHFGVGAETIVPVAGGLGGSSRRIVRLAAGRLTAVGVMYGVREENVAFLEFTRHFLKHGLNVPRIYGADLDRGVYLEEDLGDTTLFEFLSRSRQGSVVGTDATLAYERVVKELPRFQVVAGRDLNYDMCYPRGRFDRQSIQWDLNYFKYYFLRLAGVDFNEQALEDDFGRLTAFLLETDAEYFLYRDFQSRNVMLRDGVPFFIDYQGGRRGALQYDIASLLFDAKADLGPTVRSRLLELYLETLSTHVDTDRGRFMRYFYPYVYVRIMQALGAYGFRGYVEGKTHFVRSVPYAVNNLRWLAANVELDLEIPTLADCFRQIVVCEKFAPAAEDDAVLKVRVSSFSFHEGIPADASGHGGGFVFDARSLPNPGREDRYRHLTGLDAPVVEFLDAADGVESYFANVTALVDASVDEYRRRGFRNLMVSFGCTGGQHRSVYLAGRLAARLRAVDGLSVTVEHPGLRKLGRAETGPSK